jgi:hypothetical protein
MKNFVIYIVCIFMELRSRKLRWITSFSLDGGDRKCTQILAEKSLGKQPLARLRR